MAACCAAALSGRVRLGVPDDYADRYLPEIMARFSRAYPSVELTVICEPSFDLLERIDATEIDLAIVTNCDNKRASETFRRERLLWVTSNRHPTHLEDRLPLALGDGLTFLAKMDDNGRPLDGRCDVVLSGITPSARFWTLTLYNREGDLVVEHDLDAGFEGLAELVALDFDGEAAEPADGAGPGLVVATVAGDVVDGWATLHAHLRRES